MSSTLDSLPTHPHSPTSKVVTRSMRSMWGRLLWKDAREVVPIWITLLFAAMLCLSVAWAMVNTDRADISPLYICGHTFIALCSVITGVYLMSCEDENRTLHLLRNLPLPPKQIVWQKLTLGGVGVVALACFIAAFTMMLANFAHAQSLVAESSYRFTAANVTLLPLFYLVIGALCAMVSRSHFYGVLIAGIFTAGAMAVLEPTWLGGQGDHLRRGEIRWIWVALSLLAGASVLLLNATHWVEDVVITKLPFNRSTARTKTVFRHAESVSPNPFPALLWQSVRQSRVLLACCFGLTIIGWIAIVASVNYRYQFNSRPAENILATEKTIMTLLWMLGMMAAFTSSISLDDKRRKNYLFFQQNRERSKWFWLSRLLPFWGLALLLTLLWNFFVFDVGSSTLDSQLYSAYINPRQVELLTSLSLQAASQSFLVSLLSLLGIVGIGHYFSMFVRNPILSFVFTGIVSVVFVALTAYVVYVNESVWFFVIPTIIATYVANWWRTKSWLATSPHTADFLMPVALPAIVLAIVVTIFINHRATEFTDVKPDVPNFADFSVGSFRNLTDERGAKHSISKIEFGTESQRQQAATLYRDAARLGERKFNFQEIADLQSWPAQKTAKYVAKNQVAIARILEAAQFPACDPFLPGTTPEARGNDRWALQEPVLVNSHYQLLQGNLSAAKLSIDAYDRVLQRTIAFESYRYDSGYYGLLLAWADHPDQKLASIESAIAQLEGTQTDIEPAKIITADGSPISPDSRTAFGLSRTYRELGGERVFMNSQYEISDLQQDNLCHRLVELKANFRLLPWEYRRLLKVGQLRTLRELNREQTYLAWPFQQRNDLPIQRDSLVLELNRQDFWPRVPIDEDRTAFSNSYSEYWNINSMLGSINWRRYALLRLGLAAYKIEHGQYPDELTQLESYYQNGLPKTTDGLMFAWFKDGLGSDLFYEAAGHEYAALKFTTHKIADSGEYMPDLIAPGNVPLLLPFSCDQDSLLPGLVEYDEEKFGINIRLLTDGRSVFVPNNPFSYYRIVPIVGTKPNAVAD